MPTKRFLQSLCCRVDGVLITFDLGEFKYLQIVKHTVDNMLS